jgi:acetyltransferase-like isoleucine patch superfamily enzyme
MARVYERYPQSHFINQAKRADMTFFGEHTGDCEVAQSVVLNDATLDITGGIYIEENVHFGHQVMLLSCKHPTHVVDGLQRRNQLICDKIIIKKNVYIGSRAIILQGVTIGEGAYVAAGAVVTKDVDSFTLVAGVPARSIEGYLNDDDWAGVESVVHGVSSVPDSEPEEVIQVEARIDETVQDDNTIILSSVGTEEPKVSLGVTIIEDIKEKQEVPVKELEKQEETDVLEPKAVDQLNDQLEKQESGFLPTKEELEVKDNPRVPPAGPFSYKDSYINRKQRGELTEEELKKER